jgi:microcystin-dependent protein
MPANSGAIAGTVAHRHSAPSGDGGELTESITNFSGGNLGDVLTATATNIPVWASAGAAHEAGMIAAWAGTNGNIPAGWLLCDGSSVATATYPELFTALGYVYGGAGANFNLPNLVDVFVRGQSTQTAATGGANNKTLAIGEIPAHTHTATPSVTDPGHDHTVSGSNTGGLTVARVTAFGPAFTGTTPQSSTDTTGISVSVSNANTGGGSSFDNQPAFLEMQYIIKA